MKKKLLILFALTLVSFGVVRSQITAPTASTSFSTSYTSGFLSSGGTNDLVYVFCGGQNQNNIGQLTVSNVGCSVVWYYYDGFSYSALGQTGITATGLESGLYMAQVDCGGTVTCYRAWVWVNQTFVDVGPIDPGCETFTLTGQTDVLDNQFVINDPPGLNFEIDEDTYIQVCFWADHTYVSDLGFYLKAPGYQTVEPNNDGVVALLPAASDWGPEGTYQSNLTIPWSVTGCDVGDMNTPCNPGNGVEEFCFATNYWLGGPALTPGNPSHVPCVCDLPIPLNGMYAPAESWSRIYGFMAGDPGWAVQIYDCEPIDYGTLNMARLTFSAVTDCGQTTFVYDSGDINSTINDNSCAASTASIYVVPPTEPAGEYTVTSSITDYSWTCTGSGFIGHELSHQIVAGTGNFPVTTSDFVLTVTESINVPGNPVCEAVASETFVTLPTDATITPVDPVCANHIPFQIQTVDGGGVWSTNAPENTIVNGMFYANVPPEGDWTVGYSLGGPCPDEDEITITVYETIEIQNFSDNICDGTLENFTVSFDVVNNHGEPTDFQYNTGSGVQSGNSSFSLSYPSPSSYEITVTDEHGCTEYILSGYKDCGCITYAGTLSTTSLIQLCEEECTDDLSHNGNEVLDANDMLEFILHDGGDPITIYAYNATEPLFCLNDISGGQTGQIYYISAIAGNASGGHVDFGDHCFSKSINTPVIWYNNPISYIAETEVSTCGLTIDLTANELLPGEVGTWVATSQFWPTGESTVHDNEISLIVSDYGDVEFSWVVVNNICSDSDEIMVHFDNTPNAYAGENFQICGNYAELEAVLSLPASSGYWSGDGSFDDASSPTTGVTSSGTQVFTWREENGACWDEDFVTVVFIQEPQPTITMGVDTVCGIVYNLNVFNVTGTGFWSAYEEGEPSVPAPLYVNGYTNPSTQVIVSYGSELADSIDFVWTESINVGGIVCTNTATKRVVFAREPVASVGAEDMAEVCGNCYEFHADTTGSGWAEGFWIAKDIIVSSYDDLTIPNATICIDSLSSFGDTAHVEVQFLWVMNNTGCTSMDTMFLTFYQRPDANAGLNDSICGNIYTLGAIYDCTENESYTPSGIWSVGSCPVGASANIQPQTDDTAEVNVSHYGYWDFIFRENNSLYPGCYSTDTVNIKFIEKPVISAGNDKDVCGTHTNMEAISAGFPGTWQENGAIYGDYTDPHSTASLNVYGPKPFVWMESNQFCTSQDTVIITFWRPPTANILTDEADSTVCGLTFYHLRAENPGSEITGYWYNINPATVYGDEFSWNTWATVPNYGYHDFYWIEQTGPQLVPGFCNDTAGPLTIRYIEIPNANAGGDTLFCGLTGYLHAIPSIGDGVWTTPSELNLQFADENNPFTQVTSNVINTGNPTYPDFTLIWTEDNSNGCTDSDTMKVIFARVPSSDMQIIAPKCFGEPATIHADEDTLQQYTWDFSGGFVDSVAPNNEMGGTYENFVYWTDEEETHMVSLISTNFWGCQSPINIDTIQEPLIPEFGTIIISDTCALGKGGIIFEDTIGSNAFFWIDPTVGPLSGTPITTVYNIPAGEYDIRVSYLTPNTVNYAYYLQTFGTANCIDTVQYEIETIGMIEAEISISADVILEDLVAPEANVIFVNSSIYDDVSKRCEWHFDDGTTQKTCDELVEHIYTEGGCYNPFLIVMNRDLPECRDTAYLETCVFVDDMSKLEVPNIFSPNGDGVNDFFQVKAQTLRTFSGTILNRWGRTVYTWENWQDYEAGWDGTLSGGTKASPGVYYYIIKAEGVDGAVHDTEGVLHLMRE